MNPGISVIIPTHNEALNLPDTLASLEANDVSCEIVVVDGDSTDGTLALAVDEGAATINSEKAHRAHQLNLGARSASAPFFLFLHADTHLPQGALDKVITTLRDSPDLVGGGFTRRFDSPSLFLRLSTCLASLRSRHLGFFLGDQAIFVRKTVFEALDGFDETLPLCEDLDFSRRLRAHGKTTALSPPALSSARRFETCGPLRTTLSDLSHAWTYFQSKR